MNRTQSAILATLTILGSVHTSTVFSQHPIQPAALAEPACDSVESRFQTGNLEFTLMSGVLFSPFIATKNRPTVNYTVTEFQVGYMLSSVEGSAWYRGNFEFVGGAFGDAIFKGNGHYIAGATAWLRYNFVPQNWRMTPFIQAGAGLTGTDVDHDLLGEAFNFNLNLGIGARVFVTSNLAFNAEYRYQHISNANLAHNNVGINAHGPMLGVSWLF